MDVVWMAKSEVTNFLKNSKGQSLVEYVLLLVVLSSLGYSIYNTKRFKDFIAGDQGFFLTMRKGIAYSYRYGREYKNDIDFEEKMEFNYQSNKHDTYFNADQNNSRFFTGTEEYGRKK
jgi:hypothetical protein